MSAPVVLYSRDPGGTNQMIALHVVLTGAEAPSSPDVAALKIRVGDRPLRVVAKDQALAFWKRAGVPAEIWDGDVTSWPEPHAEALLTATSDIDDRSPQRLWRWAADRSIFTAAFVDGPHTPDQRFRTEDGARIVPDLIFASDRESLGALADAGLPADRLRLAGALHEVRVRALARAVGPERIASLRRHWDAQPGERVVLFASDCGREIAAAGRAMAYDEIEGLQRLLRGKPGRVVIRPHPKDTPGKYQSFVSDLVRVSSEEDSIAAILAADVVAGMASALLVEATVLQRPARSLWPAHPLYRGDNV